MGSVLCFRLNVLVLIFSVGEDKGRVVGRGTEEGKGRVGLGGDFGWDVLGCGGY